MSEYESSSRLRARFAGLAFVLIALFVGIIPIVIDMSRMPSTALPDRSPPIAAWSLWPVDLGPTAGSAGREFYRQLAGFGNRSAYPMAVAERVVRDRAAGRATGNDLYEAARATTAAIEDERDALMGLVLPPEIRRNPLWVECWKEAQLASLAKLTALRWLEDHASEAGAGTAPEFRSDLADARMETNKAIALAHQAGPSRA